MLPESKLGAGNYISVFSSGGANYYAILGDVYVATDGGYYKTSTGSPFGSNFGLTPLQAYLIDRKIDEGYPTTGKVNSSLGQLTWGNTAGTNGAASAGNCGNTDTTPTSYNTGGAFANSAVCAITIRAQF